MGTLRVYIAAAYQQIHYIREVAKKLADEANVDITSTWMNEAPKDSDLKPGARSSEGHKPFELAKFAATALEEIRQSDWLAIVTSHYGAPRGGRHVEAGYALGQGKKVMAVGDRENIFYYLPEVVHLESWWEAIEFFKLQNESKNHREREEKW